MTGPALPVDGHVHSEWSWDAPEGSMARTCARAVEIGLPGLAFTEHADFTPWDLPAELHPQIPARLRAHLDDAGRVAPPSVDAEGYLAAIAAVRETVPGLVVRSGVELSEPHRHPEQAAALLAAGDFDQVLGSGHAVFAADGTYLVGSGADGLDPAAQVRTYLAEVLSMVSSDAPFAVLAHIDYPVRYAWHGPFDPAPFRDEFHAALVALAASGRALEINTRVPLAADVVRWWADVGGRDVTVASDAHRPEDLAAGFADAAALAATHGFTAADPATRRLTRGPSTG